MRRTCSCRIIALTSLAFFLAGLLCTGIPAQAIPAGTETRISFSQDPGCTNILPSSDNGWIVWEESCPDHSSIIAYNYATGVQRTLPNSTLFAHAPAIRGYRVVWDEGPHGDLKDIYYADLNSASTVAHHVDLPVSYKENPAVDRDTIVWQNQNPSDATYDILLYNLTSATLYNLTPGTTASNQMYPSVSNGIVVWQDERDGGTDIYYNNTSDWSLHSLPDTPTGAEAYLRPKIHEGHIVWYDAGVQDIFQNDLVTTTQITTDGNPKSNPAVCASFVVWKEDTSGIGFGPYEVMLLTPSAAFPEAITDSSAIVNAAMVEADPDTAPVVITRDNRILWVDDRNGQDIYQFTYGTTTTCPVVQFTTDPTEGNSPLTVRFADTSLNTPTHWRWTFGDGTTAAIKNPVHGYSANGVYRPRLTVGTPYCRNATPDSQVPTISVGVPSVRFSANSTEGLAPLAIAFAGSATNAPTGWSWDFGDGGTAAVQNPVHTYAAGTYTVNLSATNTIGPSFLEKTDYITALNGIRKTASTPVSGIVVAPHGSVQAVTLDKTQIPTFVLSPDGHILTAFLPASAGWQNITFVSADAGGFAEDAAAVTGPFGSLIMEITDINPTIFSAATGSNLLLNYRILPGRYIQPGTLTTQVWEGVAPSDLLVMEDIIHGAGFTSKNISYTMTTVRQGIPASGARLNLSVSSAWATGPSDIGTERQKMFVIAEGYNTAGDHIGIIFPAQFSFNDTVSHREFFITEIPPQYSYLSKFALAKLSGSGNPFQLITLTVASHVSSQDNPGQNTHGDTGSTEPGANAAAGKGAAPRAEQQNPDQKAPAEPRDPGKTAALYANAQGVITQETSLTANNGLATLTVGKGITARDRDGNAIASIGIASLPEADLPSPATADIAAFGGQAYELTPDGAVFSPGITLTFAIPQAQWNREYSIRMYDHTTGTWQDLPGHYDPERGTISATVPHFCCVALFASPTSLPAASSGKGNATVPSVTVSAPAPPPTTAISIFLGAMMWGAEMALKNSVLIFSIVLICVGAYAGIAAYRKRRDY